MPTSRTISTTPAGKTVLLAAEPQLVTSDIAASIEFYTKKLGFAVAFSYGDPPFYAQVFRDGARLNLRYLDAPAIGSAIRDREQLLSASIVLDDARPLFLEYQAAGVEVAQSLRSEPWGARTFVVRDPDGNLILFAGHGD
jgi:catechol 2,3-dioxygenase-like lactoylglutathione lyase family enzyme